MLYPTVIQATNMGTITLNVGETKTVYAENNSYYTVSGSWSITGGSSFSFASKSQRSCTIRGVKAGTATITVKSTDGSNVSATCKVTIKPNTTKNGLLYDPDGNWRLYSNGVVRQSFTGLYPYGTSLFYLRNGVLDRSFNDVEYYQGSPYLVLNGQVTFTATGLGKYKNSLHYFVKNKKDYTFNGIAYYQGQPYYVVDGVVNLKYTGLGRYSESLHYFTNSLKDPSFTGIAYYQGEPYYVLNGIVTFRYTGIAKYKDTYWYIKESKVNTSYSGKYKYKGITYTIKKGRVTSPKPNFN